MNSPYSTVDFRRRALVVGTLTAISWTLLPAGRVQSATAQTALPPVAEPSPDHVRFLAVSQQLTGKTDLDPVIAVRTSVALQASDDTFAGRFAALDAALQAAAGFDMRNFDNSPVGRQPALKATAVQIVAAWYLGVVGHGATAQLISYRDALMYRPTLDVTTVPSYQHGAFGYWSAKPA
jgi:hypothetical protein